MYNTLGEQVMLISQAILSNGVSTVSFDVSNLTRGIYFIKLTSDTYSEVQKFQVY
jgi:hypothetical protein